MSIFDKMKHFYDAIMAVSNHHSNSLLSKTERRGVNKFNEAFNQFFNVVMSVALMSYCSIMFCLCGLKCFLDELYFSCFGGVKCFFV